MFMVTLQVRPKAALKHQAIQALWALSAAYHRSGQLVGNSIVSEGPSGLTLTGIVHERTSLSPRHDPSMARLARKRLRHQLRARPKISLEPLVEDLPTCECAVVEEVAYSPQPHPLSPSSPLQCRRCRGWVPLYRFKPRLETDHEFGGLLSSETIWQGLFWAWMDSAETEVLGWNQIADPDSELGKLVRSRLRSFAKRHRISAYYHLVEQYWTEKGLERTLCPGCGRPWSSDQQENRLTCRRCWLTTGVSSDGQIPDWWRPLPRHRR